MESGSTEGNGIDGGIDFDDLDGLENYVVPELERRVGLSDPGSLVWMGWVVLTGLVRQHVMLVRRLDAHERRMRELAAMIDNATDTGVEEVVRRLREG